MTYLNRFFTLACLLISTATLVACGDAKKPQSHKTPVVHTAIYVDVQGSISDVFVSEDILNNNGAVTMQGSIRDVDPTHTGTFGGPLGLKSTACWGRVCASGTNNGMVTAPIEGSNGSMYFQVAPQFTKQQVKRILGYLKANPKKSLVFETTIQANGQAPVRQSISANLADPTCGKPFMSCYSGIGR